MYDIKDTIRRLRHLGRTVDLTESSSFVNLADSLISIERERLDRAVALSRKVLSDYTGKELDRFWGAILKLGRLPGIEDASDFTGDPSYVRRIQRYMEAANNGSTLESVRVAAESGSGVEMVIQKSGERIILIPVSPISASQKAGALKAARRLAPAKAIVEIGTPESFGSSPIQKAYSPHNYVGINPEADGLSGRRFVSDSYVISTRSDSWQRPDGFADGFGNGSLSQTDGLPSNLMDGGVWHTQPLPYGKMVTLEINTTQNPYNTIVFDVSEGEWLYVLSSGDQTLYSDTIVASGGYSTETIRIPFHTDKTLYLSITNAAQRVNDLSMRGLSVRAEVDDSNREEWVSRGGIRGESKERIVQRNAERLLNSRKWLSSAATSPTHRKDLYLTLSEVPVRVSSLGFNTSTPGATFEVYYSTDRLGDRYEDLEWKKLSGVYELRSERVKVKPFRGCHVLLRFSNLRPMMLKQFDDSEGLVN